MPDRPVCPHQEGYGEDEKFEWQYDSTSSPLMLLNKRLSIYWPNKLAWFVCVPTMWSNRSKLHRVEYADGEVQWLNLHTRVFSIVGKCGVHEVEAGKNPARPGGFGSRPGSFGFGSFGNEDAVAKPLENGDSVFFQGKLYNVTITPTGAMHLRGDQIVGPLLSKLKHEYEYLKINLQGAKKRMTDVQNKMICATDDMETTELTKQFQAEMSTARKYQNEINALEKGSSFTPGKKTEVLVIDCRTDDQPTANKKISYTFENGEFTETNTEWEPSDRLLGSWYKSVKLGIRLQPPLTYWNNAHLSRDDDGYQLRPNLANAANPIKFNEFNDGWLVGEMKQLSTKKTFTVKIRLSNCESKKEKLVVSTEGVGGTSQSIEFYRNAFNSHPFRTPAQVAPKRKIKISRKGKQGGTKKQKEEGKKEESGPFSRSQASTPVLRGKSGGTVPFKFTSNAAATGDHSTPTPMQAEKSATTTTSTGVEKKFNFTATAPMQAEKAATTTSTGAATNFNFTSTSTPFSFNTASGKSAAGSNTSIFKNAAPFSFANQANANANANKFKFNFASGGPGANSTNGANSSKGFNFTGNSTGTNSGKPFSFGGSTGADSSEGKDASSAKK
eukprot:jgi/Bigna1/137916/aug1.41_g12624